jgi:hypothetical protein
MKITTGILVLLLTFGVSTGWSQSKPAHTNSIPVPVAPAITTNSSLDDQLIAVGNALPQFFSDTLDPVEGTRKIAQINDDTLVNDNADELQLQVVCFLHPPSTVPTSIGLLLTSHTSEWRYLENHEFTIRYDAEKFTPSKTDYYNRIMDDATVTETIWPDLSLEQFHQIAWSEQVYFRVGYKNFEITKPMRQKWKLLWKYFDLQQQKRDAAATASIGDK